MHMNAAFPFISFCSMHAIQTDKNPIFDSPNHPNLITHQEEEFEIHVTLPGGFPNVQCPGYVGFTLVLGEEKE